MKQCVPLFLSALLLSACLPSPAAQTSEVSKTLEVLPTFTPTPAPTETPTPTPTPEQIVTKGEAARAGIPVGAELKGREYIWHNPVTNRDLVVGSLDASGKPVKAEFLNYGLVSCTESLDAIVANELPVDFAINGGANKIAILLDNEPFPETVLLGQKFEKAEVPPSLDGSRDSVLRWSKEAQRIFNIHPEKMPHKVVGCFSVKSDLDGFTYIGIVHKWQNPDGAYRYITTFIRDIQFSGYPLADFGVFVSGWGVEGNTPAPYKFIAWLEMDPARNDVLQKWVDEQAVPLEAENYAFAVGNYRMKRKK